MFKILFTSCLIGLSCLQAADSQISKYSATINEYNSETRSNVKKIKPSQDYSVSIGQDIDQKTFAKICSDLKWLTQLSTSYGNKNLESFAPLAKLTKLRHFEAINWNKSEETPIDLNALEALTELEELNFYATRLTNTAALSKLTKLKKLSLYMSAVDDISFLSNLLELEELDLYGFAHTFKDYTPLEKLVKLKKLNTYMNTQATNENMAIFSNLTQLEEFSSSNNDHITHIDFLSKASELTELNLKWCRKLKNIDALKNCSKLKEVDLTDALINSIAVLENKIHLKELNIEGTKVTDLSPLNSCKQLQDLNIAETAITDISALENCPNLKSLNLNKTKIKDLSPLHKSKYLRRLSYSINIPNEEIEILKKLLPECKFRINN